MVDEEDGEKILKSTIGKIIKNIALNEHEEGEYEPTCESVRIEFTDGTAIELKSYDWESYVSGIDIKRHR